MSLYSKYQELGLRDDSLLSWLPVSGGSLLSDQGPNGNDWAVVSGSVVDNTDYFTNSGALLKVNDNSRVVFAGLSVKRFAGNTSAILHNYSGGVGDFLFGVLPSDQFFVGRPDDPNCGIYIFDDLTSLPSHGLFAFNKNFNDFTLSFFEYESEKILSQTISIPASTLDYSYHPLMLGGSHIVGFDNSNLEIHEAFVMDRKTPDHVSTQLYPEVNSGVGERNLQISVFDNNNSFLYEDTSGVAVHRGNSNFAPYWSNSPSGFSTNGSSLETGSRLFSNGVEVIFNPTSLDTRVLEYSSMAAEDNCIYDSFADTSYVGTFPIGVSGSNYTSASVNPFGEIVYDNTSGRLSPFNLDYLSVGSSSPIFGQQAYAYNKQNIETTLGTGDAPIA